MSDENDQAFFEQNPLDVTPLQIAEKAVEIIKRGNVEGVIVIIQSEKDELDEAEPCGCTFLTAGFTEKLMLVGLLEMSKAVVVQDLFNPPEQDGI